MNANNVKTKLCWNCEGRVAFTEENCTYCGVYLSPTPIGNEEEDDDIPPPPYRMDGAREVPPAPYQTEEIVTAKALPADAEQGMKTVLMPLSLLLSGSIFFLFGLVLFLFSSANGVFTLQWNGELWSLYFFVGVLMLFFGWRTLRHIED